MCTRGLWKCEAWIDHVCMGRARRPLPGRCVGWDHQRDRGCSRARIRVRTHKPKSPGPAQPRTHTRTTTRPLPAQPHASIGVRHGSGPVVRAIDLDEDLGPSSSPGPAPHRSHRRAGTSSRRRRRGGERRSRLARRLTATQTPCGTGVLVAPLSPFRNPSHMSIHRCELDFGGAGVLRVDRETLPPPACLVVVEAGLQEREHKKQHTSKRRGGTDGR